MRIPFLNKDKNSYSDLIAIKFYMQAQQNEFSQTDSVYIGECNLAWKGMISDQSEWFAQNLALTDPAGLCSSQVKGAVKVLARWIPVDHPDSNFNPDGTKKGAEPVVVEQKQKDMQAGNQGMLEVYPF